MTPVYRAEHIGSLLRPKDLLETRASYQRGDTTPEELREIEDKYILEALELQREVGVSIYSDGEYRRAWFAGAFEESVEGIVIDPKGPVDSRWQGHGRDQATATSSDLSLNKRAVVAPLKQIRRLAAHESSFLNQHAPGPFKVTLPGVMNRAILWYKPGQISKFYPTRADLVQDMVEMVQREVTALISEGVPYIQLDSLDYVTRLADPRTRDRMKQAGEDPNKELEVTIAADNASLSYAKGTDVTIGLHMCRGNNRSAWIAEGSYEATAEQAFNTLQVDRFLLEYDTERSGGFEPLRFMPKNKTVVLGLISTKDPTLESVEQIMRMINEAAKYVSIDNLSISPQCGFASTSPGNLLSWDDQKRKLELVAEVARKVWG
jgi:5-methyltetrahydropteroyltriglutamate--homocysteine methyltransferase